MRGLRICPRLPIGRDVQWRVLVVRIIEEGFFSKNSMHRYPGSGVASKDIRIADVNRGYGMSGKVLGDLLPH